MPLTHYLVTLALPGDPQQTLLYSTRKASLAALDTSIVQRLMAGETPPGPLRVQLEALGLWVSDLAADEAAMRSFLDEINHNRTKATISVILGMACNFACRYCYEGKQKESGQSMTDDTVRQSVSFITNWCRQQGKERLVLSLYGGEPLLYPKLIRRFATLLKPALAEHGIGFGFSLVSNGSLLTPQLVEEFLELGLLGAKITIDGPAASHNHLRPFKNGDPSFEAILNNLAASCQLLRVDLGGNFTQETWQHFPELLDQLTARGITPERLGRINFSAAMGVTDTLADTDFTTGCFSVNEPWHAEAVVTLRREILERGFNSAKVSTALCMMDLTDALVINHDGGLYKCPAMIGHRQFQSGDIRQGVAPDLAEIHNLGHWRHEARCRTCAYLPLCLGGCRYSAYQREGEIKQVDCQEGYFRSALPGLILQDLHYHHGKKSA